ncbi:hypothetical protein FRC02_008042 [Tulasnella sp. 418]|nr:hypothetical protein FRC02_008042 [Tulasnella sp. 418]
MQLTASFTTLLAVILAASSAQALVMPPIAHNGLVARAPVNPPKPQLPYPASEGPAAISKNASHPPNPAKDGPAAAHDKAETAKGVKGKGTKKISDSKPHPRDLPVNPQAAAQDKVETAKGVKSKGTKKVSENRPHPRDLPVNPQAAAQDKVETAKGVKSKGTKKVSESKPHPRAITLPVGGNNRNRKGNLSANAAIRVAKVHVNRRTVNVDGEEGNNAGFPQGAGERTGVKDQVHADKPNPNIRGQFPPKFPNDPSQVAGGRKNQGVQQKVNVGRSHTEEHQDEEENHGNRRIAMAHPY